MNTYRRKGLGADSHMPSPCAASRVFGEAKPVSAKR